MPATTTNIDQLQHRLNVDWPSIRAARDLATTTRTNLRTALSGFDSADTAIVVSGSLAREEFTAGGDIDWTLLIDGISDPGHHELTRRIGPIVKNLSAKETGAEGTFSSMVFSHDLIHDIGGEDDTNRNTTRRLLLLLESAPVTRDDAYRRVSRNILSRYLLEDRGFWQASRYRVPRFLQNDFARLWRTMAVDFAYKLRKRSGSGWAIRDVKLRMSRKLMYVSGLLACFGCHFDHDPGQWRQLASTPDGKAVVIRYFESVLAQTPLEILAARLLRHQHLDNTARKILNSYEGFLTIVADIDKRDHLEKLSEEHAATDEIYGQARRLSSGFRDGVQELFFDAQSGMDALTRNYGVF